MKEKLVIIGASAAGISAAFLAKKLNPEVDILLVRNVPNTPVPCGIPYIYGTLKEVSKNIISDQQLINSGIEIKIGHVTKIEPSSNFIIFDNGEKVFFDKLLLATGSLPFLPPIDGINLKNVYTIKKNPLELTPINDSLKDAKDIVIIGGGFIGVEMSEQIASLKGKAANVTIIEMLPYCLMTACEIDLCVAAEDEMKKLGINILTKSQVVSLSGDQNGNVSSVNLKDGKSLKADLVIIAIGAVPNTELALNSGIEGDKRSGIKVDKFLRTNFNNIYAAGDCVEKFSFVTGEPAPIRLASVAAYEGVIAISNLLGCKLINRGALGAFSTKIGDTALGAAGLTKEQCERANIEYIVGEFTGPDKHPATLPNTVANMKAILIFRKNSGLLIGGHIKGGESTGQMVNIVATAIQARLTVEDLYNMQVATHPLLTGSPVAFHINKAAEDAYIKYIK